MTRLLSVVLLVMLGVTTAGAGEVRLSLREAIDMALEKNGRVRASGHAVEAARQGVAVATSRLYPVLSFDEEFAVSNSPTRTFMMKLDEGKFTDNDFLIQNLNAPDTRHDFRTALTLRLPLYNPAVYPARELAAGDLRLQDARHSGIRQETAFRVFSRYLAVQKAGARLAVAEQAVSDAREHLRIAGVRTRSEVGLRSDELRAKTHLAAAEQQLISARNNHTIASLELGSIIGLSDGQPAALSEQLPAPQPIRQTVEELAAAALVNGSEAAVTRVEEEKAEAGIRLARAAYLPTVNAMTSYQMNSAHTPFGVDNDSWSAGVSLNWQLFDGFRRCREKERARAEHAAASEQSEYVRRETALRVRESYLRSEEMARRLDVARNAVNDAEETVRLLGRRFENSLTTMVELLDAQSALNQARADLVDSGADLALARGHVYHAAGIFLKEMTR